jgi:CTP synthase (EC 6.3.4.2)
MRLGAYYAVLQPGSKVSKAYNEPVVSERHRHRYEFNSAYRARFEEAGFMCSGTSPDKRLVEFIELEQHPFGWAPRRIPNSKVAPIGPIRCFAT